LYFELCTLATSSKLEVTKDNGKAQSTKLKAQSSKIDAEN